MEAEATTLSGLRADRDIDPEFNQHVRTELKRGDELVQRLTDSIAKLGDLLGPVLRPRNDSALLDTVPEPVRCPLADDVARHCDRLFALTLDVDEMRARLDI